MFSSLAFYRQQKAFKVQQRLMQFGRKFNVAYNYDSTSIRRAIDCLSKVIKVTMT